MKRLLWDLLAAGVLADGVGQANRSLCGAIALGLFAGVTGQAEADYLFNTLIVPGANQSLAFGIDYEAGNCERLIQAYPAYADLIRRLCP
jgi:hypothetical protein